MSCRTTRPISPRGYRVAGVRFDDETTSPVGDDGFPMAFTESNSVFAEDRGQQGEH